MGNETQSCESRVPKEPTQGFLSKSLEFGGKAAKILNDSKTVLSDFEEQMIAGESLWFPTKELLASKTKNPIVLKNLSGDKDENTRALVAHNKYTPSALLSRLSMDDSLLVREAVSGNPNTPSTNLMDLYLQRKNGSDPCKGVDYKIFASNHATPGGVLLELAKDKPSTWSDLVKNASLPKEGISHIIKEGSNKEKEELAKRPDLTREHIAILEQNLTVRWTLKENQDKYTAIIIASQGQTEEVGLLTIAVKRAFLPGAKEKLIEGKVELSVFRKKLLAESSTDASELSRLATDKNDSVKVLVAENVHTLSNDLAKLAGADSKDVWESVAKNPKTPPDALEKLYRKDNWKPLREALASNPSCPKELLLELAKQDPSLWVKLAENTSLPPEWVNNIILEGGEEERISIARRRGLTLDQINTLKNDQSMDVRFVLRVYQKKHREKQAKKPTVMAAS